MYFAATIAMIYYFSYVENVNDKTQLILFFAIFFSLQFIPLLALHLNYYVINKGDTLKLNPENRELVFTHINKDIIFSLDDIDRFIVYKSFALKFKNVYLFAFDAYNHAVITLNNGNKIVITSLLTGGEFAFPIPEEKITLKANYYRWASGPSFPIDKFAYMLVEFYFYRSHLHSSYTAA